MFVSSGYELLYLGHSVCMSSTQIKSTQPLRRLELLCLVLGHSKNYWSNQEVPGEPTISAWSSWFSSWFRFCLLIHKFRYYWFRFSSCLKLVSTSWFVLVPDNPVSFCTPVQLYNFVGFIYRIDSFGWFNFCIFSINSVI